MNPLVRLFLVAAHRLQPFLRRFSRRPHRSAAVAVWSGGELLVVKQSYRPGFTLPGGGAKAGESVETAACRELREEVGIVARPEELRSVYATLILRIFEYHPETRPAISVDGREVIEAEFSKPNAIPEPQPCLRAYLGSLPVLGGPGGAMAPWGSVDYTQG